MSTTPTLPDFDPVALGFPPDYDPTRDDVSDQEANAAAHGSAPADSPAADDAGATHAELPPADRAWHLFCQGMTYSAIARQLHLNRHTVARSIKQLHDQTQADRRADRALALTRALDALAQLQAKAWEQLAHEEGQERIVWDLYLRAAAQAAAEKGAMAGGYTIQPPTYRPQTARLLTLILTAIRETARLELLYEPAAPARDGDFPADEPQDRHVYIMMRRSDQEALARLHQHPGAAGTRAAGSASPFEATPPSPDCPEAHSESSDPSVASMSSVSSVLPLDPVLPPDSAPPFEVRDADGNIPMEHTHPKPDLRPDGTDDWYVHKRASLTPPANLPSLPGAPSFRRRRPWDRRR